MTKEQENALHCLKVMIDEEVCEECDLYGTTGTDHCEKDCVRVAIQAIKDIDKMQSIALDLASENDDLIEKMDSIRAEIEELPKTYPFINHIDSYVKEDDVKKIIDKYRTDEKPKGICEKCGSPIYCECGRCHNCGFKYRKGGE